MPNPALQNIAYTDLFTALGKFIASKELKDVCVIEFEDGVIVSGSIIYETHDGFRRRQETFVLSAEEIRAWMNSDSSGKRSVFSR
jgi:hypothetical protein